jgi:hypothetical protein
MVIIKIKYAQENLFHFSWQPSKYLIYIDKFYNKKLYISYLSILNLRIKVARMQNYFDIAISQLGNTDNGLLRYA